MTQELKFSECTLLKLEKRFGLVMVDKLPALTAWLQQPAPLSEWERQSLLFFQRALIHNVHSWNEIELIQNFIGRFLPSLILPIPDNLTILPNGTLRDK
jgi:hypothetical protein